MAQQIEKVSQDVLDKINKSQTEANALIFELGQISLRIREYKNELQKLEQIKVSIEEQFDNLSLQLENTLTDLQKKYPNGELDLQEGVVKFEIPEGK
jgi:predicted nuclease with TOPRIM domain